MAEHFIKAVDTAFTPWYYIPVNVIKRFTKGMKDMRFPRKESALTASVYIDLRRKVNFKECRGENVETAIANSLYSAVVLDDERPVGIARIVGDDRVAFFIKDVAVDPVYQKGRIGSLPTRKLQEYLAGTTYEGVYAGLMSTLNCVPFYKKHGFLERSCGGMELGVTRFYDPCEVRE